LGTQSGRSPSGCREFARRPIADIISVIADLGAWADEDRLNVRREPEECRKGGLSRRPHNRGYSDRLA
jgi:hypothetical protein